MTQHLVTTIEGKISSSEPALPLSDVDLQWVNDNRAEGLYRALQTKLPAIHCEILAIDWDKDIVQHLVIIQ